MRIHQVELFCSQLAATFKRIHVLINNAAQTLTRPPAWFVRMAEREEQASATLTHAARSMLHSPSHQPISTVHMHVHASLLQSASHLSISTNPDHVCTHPDHICTHPDHTHPEHRRFHSLPTPSPPLDALDALDDSYNHDSHNDDSYNDAKPSYNDAKPLLTGANGMHTVAPPSASNSNADALLPTSYIMPTPTRCASDLSADERRAFPERALDESRQPLDLSGVNSWSRRLGQVSAALGRIGTHARMHPCTCTGEHDGDVPGTCTHAHAQVSTMEMCQTLAANAAAPFILCSRLAPLLQSAGGEIEPCAIVVNVTAVEGKFSVGKKSNVHPHTNMAKAALNMLTFTSASSFYTQYRCLMNSVDTGWVTDMAPGGMGIHSTRHVTHVGPPLDEEDGAARVLDPLFSHLADREWLVRG